MTKLRNILGISAAVIILLSAAAHAFLGWPGVRGQLEAAHATPQLVLAMKVGWLFGSVAMLVFASIVLAIFLARLRGEHVSAFGALVIGIAYLAFGAWAVAATNDPFFAIFLVPGALLVFASFSRA